MKRWFAAAFVLLGSACAAAAQQSMPSVLPAGGKMQFRLAASPSPGFVTRLEGLAPLGSGDSAGAAAMPPAAPRSFAEDNGGKGSLEMGLAYVFLRFRSAQINSSMNGLSTSGVYHVAHRLGIEGNVTSAFGPMVAGFDREHAKYAFCGGGARMLFGGQKWRPWAHALVGGVHMWPQTAGNSQWGLAVQVGGGADLHWRESRVSFRLEGDFVRSQLYKQGQNNFQFVSGPILRLW